MKKYKVCTKCNKKKKLDKTNFSAAPHHADGFASACRACKAYLVKVRHKLKKG